MSPKPALGQVEGTGHLGSQQGMRGHHQVRREADRRNVEADEARKAQTDREQELAQHVDRLVEKEAVAGAFDAAQSRDRAVEGIPEPVHDQGGIDDPKPSRITGRPRIGQEGHQARNEPERRQKVRGHPAWQSANDPFNEPLLRHR